MLNRREFMGTTKVLAGTVVAERLLSTSAFAATDVKSDTPIGREQLLENLAAVKKDVETITTPDGTTLVILPYGGRLLGVYAPGSAENFYWTNTALNTVKTAQDFFASDAWQNTGGDRTWLAPEVDLFFPNFPDKDPYFQPRQLDPGNYRIEKKDNRIHLVNRLTVTLSRSRQKVDLEITKHFGASPNPLRYETDLNLEAVAYAGYTQFTTLAILGKNPEKLGPVGLWNLVQMPHGGDMLIPTYAKSQPKLYFGNIPDADLSVTDHLIRYRMRQKGEHKMGVRAVATTGRVGYIYPTADKWALIVRNFVVNPSGEYVDVPWNDVTDRGYSTQACNVNSGLGSFSELEYHIPAIGQGTGRIRCDDSAEVWAFRGTEADILTIARRLVSPTT